MRNGKLLEPGIRKDTRHIEKVELNERYNKYRIFKVVSIIYKETKMKLKNVLIVVNDIEKSKAFYKHLFGLDVIADFDGNVVLTEGLALQEKKIWKRFIQQETVCGGNDAELYFEENDIDSFLEKLETSKYEIEYLNKCIERDWGQRVIRLYDPDKHIIEIGESMEYVARRFLKTGMSAQQVSEKTQLPLSQIKELTQT